jgi:protein-arginine deiminase
MPELFSTSETACVRGFTPYTAPRRKGMRTWIFLGATAWLTLGCGSSGGDGETGEGANVATATSSGSGAGGELAGASGAGGADPSTTSTTSTTGGATSAATSTSSTASVTSVASSTGSGNPVPEDPVDLRADTNRDGIVDFTTADDDVGEDDWTADHGAVFLANLDDDQLSCPTNVSDVQLATCNDAADEVINGPDDLQDLARLATRPWPDVPMTATATVTIASDAASYVRLFKKTGANYTVYKPGSVLTSAELEAGIEFAIEGRDIVRKASVWDGLVDVTLTVNGAGNDSGSDVVRMRVAPAIFRHHLDPVSTYYVSKLATNSSLMFRTDLANAAKDANIPGQELAVSDQWTQDFFETAYTAMPAVGGGGKHVIHLNFRSANYSNSKLRAAGKVVFDTLRGKDVGGVHLYDPKHADSMDTLNSFGNLETIPPYTNGGKSWPLGRVIRGGTNTFYPDPSFDAMVSAQGVQGVVYVDTSWLLVAHVDETLSFVKAQSPRGWVMLVSDPTSAKKMLEEQKAKGFGSTKVFSGLYWADNSLAQTTISGILANPDVMNESAWAATQIADQVADVKAETGLTDSELVSVPFLFWQASSYSVAYQPGTVNGAYLSDAVYAAPKPHGPVINGVDLFEAQLSKVLEPFGVKTRFIENWYLYHVLDGEVHCGSNVTRLVPANTNWWEG